MTANKTTEILQQQINKLNQEQTETKWNEKDKKLFEKFLELVHDDPFRIFYADGGEVHRILELVYPESVKVRIEELFRIKYVYDGFLKYGEVVKPQIEIERPNLETLIKDISDHYLDVYRKRKKVKENAIKNCRAVLEKSNKNQYITMEDCSLLLDLSDRTDGSIDEKVLLLTEVLENNNVAIQELLKLKMTQKTPKRREPKEISFEEEDEEPVVMEAIVPEAEEEVPVVSMIEPDDIVESDEVADFYKDEPDYVEMEEISFEEEPEEVVESTVADVYESIEDDEESEEEIQSSELLAEPEVNSVKESYIELYLHALEEIDSTDIPAIHSALPNCHMPNFSEIMNSLIIELKEQIADIKEREQDSDLKTVRALKEELGKAQQLLKTMSNYLEKNENKEEEKKEKIVEGEEIQLLLLETEDGDSLIEKDFKKQLNESQYGIAMGLLQTLEQFGDPAYRLKAKQSPIPGIMELTEKGVHIFFEPFAENTYIVIALLAEKNGYSSWVEDKLRLRHCLFQRQEKGMQRRWNQHGTRNTMLLGSEAAYLDMQDMAEKR